MDVPDIEAGYLWALNPFFFHAINLPIGLKKIHHVHQCGHPNALVSEKFILKTCVYLKFTSILMKHFHRLG